MEDIQKSYDAVYISIGAHNDKKIGIEGEDAENVVSASACCAALMKAMRPISRVRESALSAAAMFLWMPPERQNVWERKASPVYTVAVWMI